MFPVQTNRMCRTTPRVSGVRGRPPYGACRSRVMTAKMPRSSQTETVNAFQIAEVARHLGRDDRSNGNIHAHS